MYAFLQFHLISFNAYIYGKNEYTNGIVIASALVWFLCSCASLLKKVELLNKVGAVSIGSCDGWIP